MKFDGTDLYAALIHELKNDLGLLSMTIDGIPLQGETAHDATVDAARLLCQGVVDRLQQALQIYKAIDQPIRPAIDAWSPQDAVHEIRDRAAALSRGRIRVEAALAPDVPEIWFFDRDLARYRRVMRSDLQRAAARWLRPASRVLLSVIPKGRLALALPDSHPVDVS